MDVIFKEGLLHLQGVKFGKRTWRKMWTVLFKPSSFGIGRLELYTVHDTQALPHQKFAWQKIAPKKVVRLCDCISITPAAEESCPQGCAALYLCTIPCTYTLASTSCQDWLLALCQLAFQKDPGELNKELFERGNGLPMTDNDLYSSWKTGNTDQSADSDQCRVIVQSTEASRRCKLDGEYVISLDGLALLLLDVHTGNTIKRWPYKLLRKIGQFEGGLSIVAGRRCDSGEGVFIFLSKQGPQIFKTITKQCMEMKKSEDSSIGPANVQRGSLPNYSLVQLPSTTAGPPVSDTEPVDALYSTINKPAKNVKKSSHVRPHVTSSRETKGEENEDEDGWIQFPEAANLNNVAEDCIYYNVGRSLPTRIKDLVEPGGDVSQWTHTDVEIPEPLSQLQPEPCSLPAPQPVSKPLPQCFSYALPPIPQHQLPPFVKNNTQAVDKMKEVEEATSLSASVAPTETPGSFKHRLAEIFSKDLAKFQPPLPSGAGSPTFPQ